MDCKDNVRLEFRSLICSKAGPSNSDSFQNWVCDTNSLFTLKMLRYYMLIYSGRDYCRHHPSSTILICARLQGQLGAISHLLTAAQLSTMYGNIEEVLRSISQRDNESQKR